jgi:hypothetical protein
MAAHFLMVYGAGGWNFETGAIAGASDMTGATEPCGFHDG